MIRRFKKILQQFKSSQVLVWGDVILDEYIFTSTRRISREAPVLITEFESNKYRLGGAGNVVMNIKTLGANPIPIGFIGKDSDSQTIKSLLKENHIQTDFLKELGNYRTPKKSRILSGGENTKKQQVLRIDTLDRTLIDARIFREIDRILMDLLREVDLLIIADYIFKSVQPEILNHVREKFPSRLITIDSRDHLINFKGVSIATPNEPELKRMFPDIHFGSEEEYYHAGQDLLTRLQAQGIILKRGSKGMIAFEKDKKPQFVDIHGKTDIVDETGAGDTVIAVASLASLCGADLVTSANLASIAAGIVVMKEGAYPIGYDELCHELG